MLSKRIVSLILLLNVYSCTRKLDLKPDESLLVPQTVADFQALLDNTDIMNIDYPVYGEAGTDDYYLDDDRYNLVQLTYDQYAYIWAKDIFSAIDEPADWSASYVKVGFSNIVLDGLDKLPSQENTSAFRDAKGIALFFRAYVLYATAQIFCKPYDSATAVTDLGLPLPTGIDRSKIFPRATLQQTYDFILNDLQSANNLLPDVTTYKTRPSKAAIKALLSRIYLGARNYEQAFNYADSSLQLYHTLLDYNQFDTTSNLSFQPYSDEVIFHARLSANTLFNRNTTGVDSSLYKTYDQYDLRKTLFFRKQLSGLITFKGSYIGILSYMFGGLAVDEVYLNRAECYARKGQTIAAMNDLNTLLEKRWTAGHFIPFTASDPETALGIILNERRKELLFRGQRWVDLRRLNKDPRFEKTLTRIVNGTTYTLPPNSARYVYPIPPLEINNSGIEQNVR